LPSPSPPFLSIAVPGRSFLVVSSILVTAGQEGGDKLRSVSFFFLVHKTSNFTNVVVVIKKSTNNGDRKNAKEIEEAGETITTYMILKMDGTRTILGVVHIMMMTMLSVTSAYVHVTIEATCNGVDWHKIPLSQDIFVGNELQRTFNEVHDDEHLINVKFEPMGKTFFGWTGDYNCLSCVRDDSLHAQWENAFASALATSDHKDVSKARKCKITMKAPMMMRPPPPAVVVEEEPSLLDQEETTSTS
jgi:hypothetical protein